MIILDNRLAQEIVSRTMRIIPFNVNVMDEHGVILASGNPSRIGELHAGALLALAKKLTVEIDAASARSLHGARPGINLPLTVNGQLCGAVGLSGAPDEVRQFGELVRLTAEMILEQANLTDELQRDSRYREAFVLNLIRCEAGTQPELEAWGARLGVSFARTQAVYLLELDGGADGAGPALTEIQRLQARILERQPGALAATVGPREMVILELFDAPARPGGEPPWQRRLHALGAMLQAECRYGHTLALGIALPGIEAASVSYRSAKAAARLGRERHPGQRQLSYYDLALPVLLSSLGTGWEAGQLREPVRRLLAHERNGQQLRRTLEAWFANNSNATATAGALHIHRNTLDYRLNRIAEATGLDLGRTDDRLLLYVSLLLTPA